jgi:hypothetical protein
MPSTIQEVYREQILPFDEKERLKLAALIINDISSKPKANGETKSTGGIRELFGSVSLGHPTGSDNESIDADLAREYGSTHEDE